MTIVCSPRLIGVSFGRRQEGGVWWSRGTRSRGRRWPTRVKWRGHDSLYIRLRHLQVRIMKPRWLR